MDYKTSSLTSSNRVSFFNAISKEIEKWWAKVDYSVNKVGDVFSIFFGETEWRFKITQYVPFEKIKWNCITANHVHEGLENILEEWLNTDVKRYIKEDEDKNYHYS
ncbi:hypothetical protein SAMN04487911_13910 [Arenibacter nanhaiticus]|uniref:Uncharacterized protein n=1 Tax=Arenibacter nanhaiticus TaxID=558155 RepID=A0A1M6M9X2_9FLAO|nr:hypothetical protein [Arenibacter nanhaiticus]SHJ80275.1 hypothetical protein SAMN04487911_13910 [Arenibacter nanhaiticus]